MANGATAKWDVSRRARDRIINPALIPRGKFVAGFGTIYDTQPLADSIAFDWPQDPLVGNDDPFTIDESNDPYQASNDPLKVHALGQLSSTDPPSVWMADVAGINGDTYEEHLFFSEFVRLEIKGKWL